MTNALIMLNLLKKITLTNFLPSKLCTTYSYAQIKFEKNEWCHKESHKKNNLSTDFNSVWWKCCMMFACQFDNNLFTLLLFDGNGHSNSKK
jgi:hypothetical protein